MENDTAIMVREQGERSVEATVEQGKKIHALMKTAMQDGLHFGKIPGVDKPCLLKPGAEKIGFMFRLLPRYDIKQTDLLGGHREYQVVCTLQHGETFAGQGVGSCSTMESKYRYRNVADFEVTGDPIPADSKEKKQEHRRQGFGMKKVAGVWEWVKYTDSQKQENPDIADTYNTVLKMAVKRAQVAATITATAASDIFAQDVEDMAENGASFGTDSPAKDDNPPKAEPPAEDSEEYKRLMLLIKSAEGKVDGRKLSMLKESAAKPEAKKDKEWLTEAASKLNIEMDRQEALLAANSKPDVTPEPIKAKDAVEQKEIF